MIPRKGIIRHELDAWMIVCLYAGQIDGAINEIESTRYMIIIMLKERFSDDERPTDSARHLLECLNYHSRDEIIRLAADAIPKEYQHTVFCMCLDIVMCGGILNDLEKEYMNNLAQWWGIDMETARKYADVIGLMHKGAKPTF